MKVSELIEVLKTHPSELEVVGEWDGMWSKIESVGQETDRQERKVVVIDVDEWNSYQ